MKYQVIFILLLLFTGIDSLYAQNTDISYMTSGGKLKPLQAIIDIRHYTIALDVDIPKQSINGYAEVELLLSKPTDTLLFDLFHLLNVRLVTVDRIKVDFAQKGDSVLITNAKSFRDGRHTIKISYGGIPPVAKRPPWLGGFTWTKDKSGNPWVVISCQLQGAKVYFPCKDHPSDEPNEGIDLFITIPNGLSVAGPGLLQGVKYHSKDKTTWHWKTNYTIANYSIVFNIGKYKMVSRNYTTIQGNTVPVQYYVLAEDSAQANHVIDMRIRDTKILESYFGEYPWAKEKIGIAESPYSGMEHQTMVTFSDKFRFHKFPGFDYSDELFHEYAHEWWANKVTNKDWAHMWIHEGITTYAEALWHRSALGEAAYDSVMMAFRAKIHNEKPVVQAEELDMTKVYNSDVYFKGAYLMHTLRYVLGDSVFFTLLKKFITDVKYPYNRFFTTGDVQSFFCSQTNKDLNPLFDFYLRTTQTLDIEVWRYQPNAYTVTVNNSPMPLPLDILTDKGILHVMTTTGKGKPLTIKSKSQPVVDPKGWYFKKLILQ